MFPSLKTVRIRTAIYGFLTKRAKAAVEKGYLSIVALEVKDNKGRLKRIKSYNLTDKAIRDLYKLFERKVKWEKQL